ncbi:hypothetical protein U1Q18_026290 [Sarracenia purpurea var. burkii]
MGSYEYSTIYDEDNDDESDPANTIKVDCVIVVDFLPDPKRYRIENITIAAAVEEKMPLASLDESRHLFQ